MIWFVVLILALVFYFMLTHQREEWRREVGEIQARMYRLERKVADVLARRPEARELYRLECKLADLLAQRPEAGELKAKPTPAPAATVTEATAPEPEEREVWESAVPSPEPPVVTRESAGEPAFPTASEPVLAQSAATPPPVIPPVAPVRLVPGDPAKPPPIRLYRPSVERAPAEPTFFEKLDWSKIDWEQFMGVKLFAWIGGLALFLGVAFFVRYSFEHNLIPPWLRVTLGMFAGLGLVGGGVLLLRRKTYVIPAQSLCATGVVILYAATFAACNLYHLIGTVPAFLGMSAITIGAFLLAAWFDALVIAILGLFGGFLTPYLLSTGQDSPFALFSYLALLDAGLIALALRKRWTFLTVMGAVGTVIMQAGWVAKFFESEQYFVGNKVLIAYSVFLGFGVLFGVALARAKQRSQDDKWFIASAILTAMTALVFALHPLDFEALGVRPGLVFGYLALVDLGFLGLFWLENQRCGALPLVAACGTMAMQADWVAHYFGRFGYAEGGRIFVAFAIFLGFAALFLGAFALAQRRERSSPWLSAAAALLPGAALAFALYLMGFPVIGARPGILFGYILLADVCLFALVWLDEKLVNLQFVAGGAAFLLLGVWTFRHLTNDLLAWGLTGAMGFAFLHAAVPVVLARRRPNAQPAWLGQLFPPIALALVLIPILRSTELSFLVWPCVLLLDLFIAVLAIVTASTVVLVVALVLTLAGAGFWLAHIPADLTGLPMGLVLLAGFAVLFFAIGAFLPRLLAGKWKESLAFADAGDNSLDSLWRNTGQADLTKQLPAMSAIMPFLLLIMVTLRLPLANPSSVFGVAMLLVVLLLGLTAWLAMDWLPAVGLACVLALEHTWHFGHFNAAAATVPLLWYLGFAGAFTAFPFLFWQKLSDRAVPWATAALALPLHFYLIHHLVKAAWPNDFMGLLPAAMALPAAAGFIFLLKKLPAEAPKRLALLALFGGATLFFITLIFPIQFHRQFITLGWALEGAALLWLYHRVPHNGLRLTGLALLLTAFVRLALNPAVLEYHVRAATPILNWYLYAYGITVICLFVGARLLAPPREQVMGSNVQAVLNSLGAVLAFLLLNLEIADFFTVPGAATLTFEFSGNLARDMTYSIAWGLFALGLLVVGFVKKISAARWAGIGLLCITLLKLFLHDLASLDQVYRIGAFIGVAVIAIAASFLYQRFLKTPGAGPAEKQA